MTTDIVSADMNWKDVIEKRLDDIILEAYGAGNITYHEMQNAADYIISTIDKCKTREEVQRMIEFMQEEWGLFEPLLKNLKLEKNAANEQVVINKLTNYIKNFPVQST